MERLRNRLRLLSKEMTDAEIEAFLNKCTIRKTLKKAEYLTKVGEIEQNLYFIKSGLLLTFYIQNAEKVYELFGAPSDFYCSYVSFLFQIPSMKYVQALEKTELIGITRADFQDFIATCWPMERIWRMQTEKHLLDIMKKDNLLRLPAQEKVAQLLKDQPNMFQLVPHKYIASYLCLSPETFSVMLKKL